MTKIVRVYPIRKTKKEWNIPFYCYHLCTQRCSQINLRERISSRSIRYILVDNPDYVNHKCQLNTKLEKTFIRLSTFDPERPMGGTGPLYEPDEIVISDTRINVNISYPLSITLEVTIISQNSYGFTLCELINSIKVIYQFIYYEEERTSVPQCYRLKRDCQKCIGKKIEDYVIEENKLDCECSICYEKHTTHSIVKLKCDHIFHKDCIYKWIENNPSCPLCRKNVIECDECDGSGFIYYDYNGTVIPVDHRGNYLNRNTTNGIFGIFGHDLEDLVIENMYYNKENRLLSLNISS